jgi:fumarate reductase subunit C
MRTTASKREGSVAANRRLLLTLLAILVVICVFVGLAAVVGWVSTYLLPVVVILGVGVGLVLLLMQTVKRLSRGHDISDWWQ